MTLVDAAQLTKKGIIVFIAMIILLTLAWFGYLYWLNNIYTPPIVIIPPELKFGKIPLPKFPNPEISSTNYTYTLDTPDGKLPEDSPSLMKVYFMPQLGATLLAPDRVKELAETLGFTEGPEKISATKHRFKDPQGGEILIDLNTNNFNYKRAEIPESSESAKQDVKQDIGDQARIIADFKNYLSSKNLLKESLRLGSITVEYNKPSQQESTRAKVSLFPSPIKDEEIEYSIITPSYPLGLVNGEVTRFTKDYNKYPILNYVYWEPELENSSTYPIKTYNEALTQLKEGKGVIIQQPPQNQVSITESYIAYFEPEEYSPYLIPVFVFKGKNFLSIVPAIEDDQIESTQSN